MRETSYFLPHGPRRKHAPEPGKSSQFAGAEIFFFRFHIFVAQKEIIWATRGHKLVRAHSTLGFFLWDGLPFFLSFFSASPRMNYFVNCRFVQFLLHHSSCMYYFFFSIKVRLFLQRISASRWRLKIVDLKSCRLLLLAAWNFGWRSVLFISLLMRDNS